MSVTKNELLDMLGKSISADLAAEATPAEQKEPVFSEDFEQRMSEFFAEGSSAKKKNKARPKRWLIVAIAAVVVLAATACAVPEIRESIAGFFVKVFGDHVEYTDPNITRERIEDEYGIVPIPEGFSETKTTKIENGVSTTYMDESQNGMILLQAAKGFRIEYVDSEHGEFTEYEIGDKIVRMLYSNESAQATWIQDGYYFSLMYPAQIELEVFEGWIASVQKKQ